MAPLKATHIELFHIIGKTQGAVWLRGRFLCLVFPSGKRYALNLGVGYSLLEPYACRVGLRFCPGCGISRS